MDSILLQKQITENAEELQNLAQDLISWEKEMKRKEQSRAQEISENQQELPPVRSKLRRGNAEEKREAEEIHAQNSEKFISRKEQETSRERISDQSCSIIDTLASDIQDFQRSYFKKGPEKSVQGSFHNPEKLSSKKQVSHQVSAQEEVKISEVVNMSDEQLAQRQKREKALFEKERGNELVKQGKYAEAIHHYTEAIQSCPDDAVFYANRALCFLNTKQFREAETDCTIALQLDPNYVKAHHRRALALKELNQLPEAQEDLQKALQIEPLNGRLKADLAKIEKLISDRVVKSAPSKESNKNTAYAFKEKGNGFVKKGNWQAAIESYTEACRLYSEDSSFYSNRALCYLKLNEPKKAILDCIRALELDANNTKALYRKALANESLGHYSAAHDDLLAAFKLEPTNKSVQDELNRIEKKLGLKQENNASGKSKNLQSTKRRISGERFTKMGGEFVKPIKKPPHLLSEKPQKKITISDKSEIDILQNVFDKIEKEPPLSERNGTKPIKHIPIKTEAPQIDVSSLPHPKTSMQFVMSWNKLHVNPFLQYQYLKRLSGKHLPDIFKDALETDVFSQILEILASEFVRANEPVYDYLYGLSNVKRFSALILFASDEDKDNIKLAIDHCNALNEVSASDIASLKSRFYY